MATLYSFDWEAEGRRLGDRLDALNAIVVLGLDPVATACVALGIARAQAPRRRVALGDMLGDAEPLRGLVQREDEHGLVDSFLYGVSLNRIGVRVPGEGELFLLPTGTEPPDYEEILTNARWGRLAAGFREVGALLIIAAPADAPGAAALVEMTDGAVLVGEGGPGELPIAKVISYVRAPRARAGQSAAEVGGAEVPRRRWSPVRIVGAIAALLILAALGLGYWFYRPLSGSGRPAWMTRRDTAVVKPQVATAGPPAGGSIGASTGVAATDSAAGAVGAPAAPVNPADSDSAAAYAVALTNANTPQGAIFYLQENGRNLPAATYAPIPIHGVRWYRVLAGAWPDSTSADSLLRALHARGILDARSGTLVRTPFAFLIDSVAAGAVPAQLARYAALGQPVYALFKSNGTARLYAGAFESPVQAAMYAESLRAAGITPVLAYRIGRVF